MMHIVCRDLAEFLSHLIRARHEGHKCLVRDDTKKRTLGFKVYGRGGTTYSIALVRVIARSVWFSDSTGATDDMPLTAVYSEREVLDALGWTNRELSNALMSNSSRKDSLYQVVPKHTLPDRGLVDHGTIQAWLMALAACQDSSHTLELLDDPMSRHLGFKDQTTGLWHRIGLAAVKVSSQALPEDVRALLSTPKGRISLVAEGVA